MPGKVASVGHLLKIYIYTYIHTYYIYIYTPTKTDGWNPKDCWFVSMFQAFFLSEVFSGEPAVCRLGGCKVEAFLGGLMLALPKLW